MSSVLTNLGPLMVDLMGPELQDEEKDILRHPLIGGVIFFSRNFVSAEQISELCQQIKAVRPELLLAVDQEGGRVQRFNKDFSRLPPLREYNALYQQNPSEALAVVEAAGYILGSELAAVGIDFSFAPVIDCDIEKNSVIEDRSFSSKPDEVVVLAEAMITGLKRAGMVSIGKHFPGHGSVLLDSHKALPVDERSLDKVMQQDIIPFQQLATRLKGIMTAHILFPHVDPQIVTFSAHWLQQILRQQLGFSGVIFSDDLSMSGACQNTDILERTNNALKAGCDMILVCNARRDVITILDNAMQIKIPENRQLLESLKLSLKPPRLQELKASHMWRNANDLLSTLGDESYTTMAGI